MAELTPPDTNLDIEEAGLAASTGPNDAEEVEPVETRSHAACTVVNDAVELARVRGNALMTTDDLFAAMVSTDCAVSRLLTGLEMHGEGLADQLAFILGRAPAEPSHAVPGLSPRVERVMERASIEAGKAKASEVSTLHLLAALLREKSGVSCLLLETPGLGLEPVGAALNKALREGMIDPS
ncbi:MAG: hypothetical protein IT335_08605 [Thermomicrobiales bacterium]|nr:hypothetical protein [Thermomicrobiales bacterium]